jgi:radical SAM/Cys-rich protein
MSIQSLHKRANELADSQRQLNLLSEGVFADGSLPKFKDKLTALGQFPIRPKPLEILQINLGYMCNQVCSHCHVDAGPDRQEIMTRETMKYCLRTIQSTGISTLDLTGGAPEMNPDFRWFVEQASQIGIKDFIVRSNLTIIEANKKYNDLPEFFKTHKIHVVSSMPHWTMGKTDKQRGKGVFNKSISALKRLNQVGYGLKGSDLKLDLVYNPSGAFLPGDQSALEADFKKMLFKDFNIEFHQLFALTNLPISRYLDYLIASENYEDYMYALVEAFNPNALMNVMCTNTLSVGWDGWLYDCDFNQMLQLKVNSNSQHIRDFNMTDLSNRTIITSQHCYGCTAGAGSSCQGSIL